MAAGDGLITMTPSSVVVTGSGSESATVNSNGSVTFTDCLTISLNGVFTSAYTNYLLVASLTSTANQIVGWRVRASGVDTTATVYDYQRASANGATISGTINTSENTGRIFDANSAVPNGYHVYIFGPQEASETFAIQTGMFGELNARINMFNNMVQDSNTYDGFTLTVANDLDGTLTVFGYEE